MMEGLTTALLLHYSRRFLRTVRGRTNSFTASAEYLIGKNVPVDTKEMCDQPSQCPPISSTTPLRVVCRGKRVNGPEKSIAQRRCPKIGAGGAEEHANNSSCRTNTLTGQLASATGASAFSCWSNNSELTFDMTYPTLSILGEYGTTAV